MKKVLVFLLCLNIFLAPIPGFAQDKEGLIDTDLSEINLSDLEGPLVKDLPEEYWKDLGNQYVLIREDYLRDLFIKSKKTEVLEESLKLAELDMTKYKTYSIRLEDVVKQQDDHINLLNGHIDNQEKIIRDLQPTIWDKHKFEIGILLGGILVGGTAYGLSRLD